MDGQASKIYKLLSNVKLPCETETALQSAIEQAFLAEKIEFTREFVLDKKNRVDFFSRGVALEVKIKGAAKSIYRQIERYASFPIVTDIILVTSKSLGFPATIDGKNCYVLRTGRAWL